MSDEAIYTTADVNRAVQEALAAERRQIAEWRTDAARLAQLEPYLDTASADREPQAATTNHSATVAAAESRELDLAALLRDTAGSAGASDPSIVAGLVDTERVTFDEHGAPSNVEQLVADVLAARPYLASAPSVTRVSADQGARPDRTSSQDDALRLLETAPREFDRLVSIGAIPRDIFSGPDR